MKASFDHNPPKTEAVGNGDYFYRWNITEFEAVRHLIPEGRTCKEWECDEVIVHGKPEYGRCVEAVIRNSYTSDEETALLNKYNAYQMGVNDDASAVGEYGAYLAFVAEVKAMVRRDLGMGDPVVSGDLSPRLADAVRVLAMTVNTMALSDEEALEVKSLYPAWDTFIGRALAKDTKVQYGGRLYKVLQPVSSVLASQPPSVATASLYTEISETHSGSADDPIPYDNNMELFAGKYYTQDGIVYRCTRSTGQPVYNPLSELVGLYVEAGQ